LDFSSFSLPVDITQKIFAVQDDPDDNKFLECALQCKADYIISGDTHLLDLKEFEGIKILRAAEFLKIISKDQSI
jgi:predicted nucleic acid-binding protein